MATRRKVDPAETAPAAGLGGVVIGRLLAGGAPAAPLVDFDGNADGPIRARTAIALTPAALERAVATRQGVVLVFENGDRRLPIVTGILQIDRVASPFEELLAGRPAAPAAGQRPPAPDRPLIEARVDGERIVIEARQEILLKCGDASITLRRDGKVVLRGAYVETAAKGINRIKGGAVKIN